MLLLGFVNLKNSCRD